MMSKKQLACMLTLHVVYLMVGAAIFYHIESPLEQQQRAEDKLERLEIQNLLYENYIPNDPEKQDSILRKLSQYCGKSMFNYTTEDEERPYKWDFYHSFFFSYTVVSTIGYGNLAPTTHLSRILMIFYALFGIPINGILLANLGEYFGLQLIKVYRKYKRRNEKRADNLGYIFHNLGMLGQIVLYLVPGFLFFIFLPACVFVVFEGWDYIGAVYFAFVTLTTIGFGDMVAGTVNNGFAYGYYLTYEIFLIVWIIFGLGYIVMLLGFITSGMRSESVHKFEQKLACQLKMTQNKILQGFTRDLAVLRKVINEANLVKLKPVYVEAAPYIHRSLSCPIFTFDVEPRDPIYKRKRANSENIQLSARDMFRIQSDTDLLGIDKEKTFQTASAIVKPAELLARVVNVLGGLEQQRSEKGIHMFADEQILASEKPPLFSIGKDYITNSPKRTRALSLAVPNYRKESVSRLDHDFTWSNGESADKFRQEAFRSGKLSLPSKVTPAVIKDESRPNIFSRFLFRKSSSNESSTDNIKNTVKGRFSIISGAKNNMDDNYEKPKTGKGSIFPIFSDEDRREADAYKEKTKRGRHSIFPTFDFNRDEDDDMANIYKEKTKRGRHSIFPTFDFSEDEDTATVKAYQKKVKRHSIFPTFDFSESEDEKAPRIYKDKTKSRRHSIFPTFDFSDPEEDMAKHYKENTKRGRHSIFPTFDFSSHKSDDSDAIDEEEVKRYQNRTKKGRFSLFPTFGKSKKSDDVMPESSDELESYQNKTGHGRRSSLFPSFGKERKGDSTTENLSDLEASIKQYRNQTKRGRNSLFSGDIQSYRNSSEGGRKSLFANDLENYREKTKRGRPSLFDSDVNMSSLPESEQVEVLENTSVADIIRALAVLETATHDSGGSFETPGLIDLLTDSAAPTRRRGSLRSDMPVISSRMETEDTAGPRRRRISARAAAPQFTPTLETVIAGAELQTTATAARENRMSMLAQIPTVEIAGESESQPRVRRYSPAPGGPMRTTTTGPVPRLFSRMRKDSPANNEEEASRHGSLTNIVIDYNKYKT